MEMPDPRSPETLDYPDTNASLLRSFPITNLAAYTIEYGADTNVQSALNLVYLLSGSDLNFELLGASDERFHIRGGNQQVPLAIAEHLKTLDLPVHTGMRLQAIRRRSDGTYQLTFDSHGVTHEVVTDLVVLTLPFAVLRTLDFHQAGFDALKTQAIEHLGRGHNGKPNTGGRLPPFRAASRRAAQAGRLCYPAASLSRFRFGFISPQPARAACA